jgi:hypothetical protein
VIAHREVLGSQPEFLQEKFLRARRPLWFWVLLCWIAASLFVSVLAVLWEFGGSIPRTDLLHEVIGLAFEVVAWHLVLSLLWPGFRSRVWQNRERPFLSYLLWFPLPPLLTIIFLPLFDPLFEYGWRAIYILPSPLEIVGEGIGLLLYFGLALPMILGLGAAVAAVTSFAIVWIVLVETDPEVQSNRTGSRVLE